MKAYWLYMHHVYTESFLEFISGDDANQTTDDSELMNGKYTAYWLYNYASCYILNPS